MEWLYVVLTIINALAIFYFVLANGTYQTLNIIAFFSLRRTRFFDDLSDVQGTFASEFYKPLCVIIPAYNEAETIADNVLSNLSIQYPELEVVVVNDGSTDDTLAILKEQFMLVASVRDWEVHIPTQHVRCVYDSQLYPNLVVIDKDNGGKADSLNAGINVAQFPLICNIDADSLIDSTSLLRLAEPFVRDRRVVAAGGTIRVANACDTMRGYVQRVRVSPRALVRFQVLEYLRAFLFGRVGWAALDCLPVISGALGVFRKNAVIAAGGYSTATVGEDMELVLRLSRYCHDWGKPYRIVFVPEALCWTQVPEDAQSLSRQRRRWKRGLGESLMLNKRMFLRRRYGLFGMFVLPFFFLVEFLGPAIELVGYASVLLAWYLGVLQPVAALLFLLAAFGMGILTSISALLLEELYSRRYSAKDTVVLIVTALLENFGYRQLNVVWGLQGLVDLLRKRQGWGTIKRTSFESKARG